MNGIEKITEEELGKIQELDCSVQIVVKGKDLREFNELCSTYGRDTILGLIYKQYEQTYGGPLRAMSMLRNSPFYDQNSF